MADFFRNLLGKLGLLFSGPGKAEDNKGAGIEDLQKRNEQIRHCYEAARAAEISSVCHSCGKNCKEEELIFDIEQDSYLCEECWNRKEREDATQQAV